MRNGFHIDRDAVEQDDEDVINTGEQVICARRCFVS
jgi:hypothetical protein